MSDHDHDYDRDHDALLDSAPAGFFSFLDDGRLVTINGTLLQLLGYDRDEIVGEPVERFFGVAARIFYQTHLFPLIRMHGRAEEIYLELRSRESERVPVLLNARRRERDGRAVIDCVVMRVRERKKYEDELLRAKKAAEEAQASAREASEAKSLYLRSVSHEIRTPINALLGYADLLELNAGRPMGEDQLGYVGRVREAARHLLGLVNDVLDLAKIESGAMSVENAPAQAAAAVEAAVGMIEPQARAQEVEVVRPEGADAGRYIGDHERVVQILINLLSNAVKFTEPGGRVELDWRTVERPEEAGLDGDHPWLRLRVTDTGVGIPAGSLDDVFAPFRQIRESDSRQGTGLGLAISREMARLMDGEITVASTPGEGSTFTVWLPAAEGSDP